MCPERFSLRTLPNRGLSSPISSTSQHSSAPFPTDETHCCSLWYSNSPHVIWTPSDQGYYPTVCVCVVAKLCLILWDPMDCSNQHPLSMEFSRQEDWSGLPLPSPGDLPHPGIKPVSPAVQADSWPPSHLGSPITPCDILESRKIVPCCRFSCHFF